MRGSKTPGAKVPVTASLDEPLSDEEGSSTYRDMLLDEGEPADVSAERAELSAMVAAEMAAEAIRPARPGRRARHALERDIIYNRLARTEDRDGLIEIGQRHGCSREYVRQVEVQLKERMRRRLEPLAA